MEGYRGQRKVWLSGGGGQSPPDNSGLIPLIWCYYSNGNINFEEISHYGPAIRGVRSPKSILTF